MTDFGHAYYGRFGHGRAFYLRDQPIQSILDVPRGYATVLHDGWTWVYRVSPKDKRAFKVWAIEYAFVLGLTRARLTGRWPHYTVEAE